MYAQPRKAANSHLQINLKRQEQCSASTIEVHDMTVTLYIARRWNELMVCFLPVHLISTRQ